jgi:glycerophosphoryl diester phosphodiesterase
MLKLGHRGASAAAPENTLGAFRMALAMGADGVELDVHRCKSGELVVIHDETVDRTTDGSGRVAGMTLGDVQALRVAKEEYIPTLEEVFAALAGAYCFVEVKQADAALPAAALICREVANGWPAGRLWLISFRHESLAAALAAYPDLLIGMSYEKLDASSIAHAHASRPRM